MSDKTILGAISTIVPTTLRIKGELKVVDKEFIRTDWSNGDESYIQTNTLIYFMSEERDAEKETIVRWYKNALEYAELRDQIISALEGVEVPNSQFYYMLVRVGDEMQGHFYPLPLLFSSDEERELAAANLGKRSPEKYWVQRRRKLIETELNIHNKK